MGGLFETLHVFPDHGLISHLGLVGVVVFVVAVVAFIGRTVYNLYLHPLRSYPGPWFARASRLPFIYYLISGRIPQEMMKWHEKYGDTIRIAPNDLSFIQGQAWNDIHGHRTAGRTSWFEKDPNIYVELPGRAHSLITSNEHDHSRFRRLLSHAFSEKALREQESLIQSHIDVLMARLHTEINSPNNGVVDMVKWLTFITFDIISDLAFGKSFNCVEEGPHPWVELILDFMRKIAYVAALGYLPTPIFKMIMSTIQYFMLEEIQKAKELVDGSVASRLEQGTSRKDFVSPILEANAGKGMTVEEMGSNFEVLMIAGSATTNTLLSGALHHLLTHDSVLQTLLAELQSAFPSRTGVSMATVSSLPYLNAVLEESLRFYPPSAHNHPRMVPHGGASICGKVVPEGTSVGVATLAAALSERNWTEPLAFKPERWIGEEWAGDDYKSWQPFLVGSRNCLGKNLAYAEMRLILARLLLEFDIELCEESREWYKDQKFYFLWELPPLKLRLKQKT